MRMARTGRPKAIILLSEADRAALERFAARTRSARRLAFRAKVILASASGVSDVAVARRVRASANTVGCWRKRFVQKGIDGLFDEPRPGAPRTIDDAAVEQVVVATLERTPTGATHWSTRTMAKHQGLSHTTVGRIWRAFGFQPHRSETFTISRDRPNATCRMEGGCRGENGSECTGGHAPDDLATPGSDGEGRDPAASPVFKFAVWWL